MEEDGSRDRGRIYRWMKVKMKGKIQTAAWREKQVRGREGGEVKRWGQVKVKRDFFQTSFLYSALTDVNGVLKSM